MSKPKPSKPFERLRPEVAAIIRAGHLQRLPQSEIARRAGVSQATVSRLITQDNFAMSRPLSAAAQSMMLDPAEPKPAPSTFKSLPDIGPVDRNGGRSYPFPIRKQA